MKVNVDIDAKYKETEVTIHCKQMDEEVKTLMDSIATKPLDALTCMKEDRMKVVHVDDIVRIFSQNGQIFVETDCEQYQSKLRLYELEQQLDTSSFVRISKQEIINLNHVDYFEASFTGMLYIVFDNKCKTYASRRYVKAMKERLGI